MAFLGTDFPINTTTDNEQVAPSHTVLSDGRIFVTWSSSLEGGTDFEIRGRLLAADGTPIGSDFSINTTPTADQNWPTVTALADGRAFIAWVSFIPSIDEFEIRGRIIEADGTGGLDFVVNSTTANAQFSPVAATLADGHVLVTWTSDEGDMSGGGAWDIRGRILDADGTPISPDFIVSSNVVGNQQAANVTALPDARALVTWTSYDPSLSVAAIFGRFVNSDGTTSTPDFRVLPISERDQAEASLAVLANGWILVTWAAREPGFDNNIHGQILNTDGSVIVPDFILNSTLAGDQFSPSVTALPDGRALVVWESSNDTGARNLYGRIVGLDGFPHGTEFLVNSGIGLTESAPQLVTLADGRVVAVWTAYDPSLNSSEIYGRMLSFNAMIDGTPGDDRIVGTSDNDVVHGGAGRDLLSGGPGNDALYGGIGNNSLMGEAGNDFLFGEDGDDRLWGGEGNDTFVGGRGADNFAGGAGIDTVRYETSSAGVHVDLAHNVTRGGDATGDLFSSIENLIGSRFGDTLIGDGAANSLASGGGRDIVDGSGGNDVLDGGEGSDELAGGLGDDVVHGGAGNDRIWGNVGNDTLTGGAGADILAGGAGTDTADYSASPGGVTVDLVQGTGSGGDAEGDTLSMIENVIGTDYNDDITGNNADNVLIGGTGDDRLFGGYGSDQLEGGFGNDILIGADGGGDILSGGRGANTFVFVLPWDSEPGHEDQITDFGGPDVSEADLIDVSLIDANYNTPGDDTFIFIGTAAFTNTAGELRSAAHYLEGDINGDGTAEFRVHLNVASLAITDLLL